MEPERETWDSSLEFGGNDNDQVLEETNHFPDPVPRPHGVKSFSNLRHPVDGLLALGRRLSVSIRRHTHHIPHDHAYADHHKAYTQSRERHVRGGSWDARAKDSAFKGYSINRRPSLHSPTALHGFYAPAESVATPIPGNGPPIIPDDACAGAAARAAAAAYNETKAEREAARLFEMRYHQDSESGIGIDLRDRPELSDIESSVLRIDPVTYLPSEIVAHFLTFLDPQSLMNCELVARSWHEQASSRHVWRHVFRQAYGCRLSSPSDTREKPSAGLGKTTPNQDWKRMLLVRRALDHRWKKGKAAAIYLQGHKDSVYCVQFDEDKIITGSRDRTIRVWDARYPWPCLKVIGPPSGDTARSGPFNNLAQLSTGKSPFLTICPPSAPSAGIVAPMDDISNYHSASILCLQFDDDIMVTGSSDYTCIVWDIKNDYKPIRRLEGHRAGVLDVCMNNKYIVSCSKDKAICVWDRHTGALLKKLLGHREPVNAVQLRGDLLVSAGGDGTAKLWNITSGQCVKEFRGKDRVLACIEFSDDARTIFTGGNEQIIHQFDANTGEMVGELKGHSDLVRSLHLDSANRRLVTGSYDMSVKVFDTDTGELSVDLPGWTTSWMLSVKSDYRRIVATSQDSRAVIVDFGYGLDGIELLEE